MEGAFEAWVGCLDILRSQEHFKKNIVIVTPVYYSLFKQRYQRSSAEGPKEVISEENKQERSQFNELLNIRHGWQVVNRKGRVQPVIYLV